MNQYRHSESLESYTAVTMAKNSYTSTSSLKDATLKSVHNCRTIQCELLTGAIEEFMWLLNNV